MSKIKVFLGAYINMTNAQNINCLSLAQHLDKNRFEVFTLKLYSGETVVPSIYGVNTFFCFNPHRISKYLGYLWGIYKCDVAYLPKGEIVTWNFFWIKLMNRKCFSTVEGILDGQNLQSIIKAQRTYSNVIDHYKEFDRLFSITKFLGGYNRDKHSIITEEDPLYLGVNGSDFSVEYRTDIVLQNVVYIGRLLKRKGVYDFLSIVEVLPDIHFHLVGDGEQKENIKNFICDRQIKNCTIHGVLNHSLLAELLATMDLHILPSRSEGFPKVTLETAAAGVPSLVYSDYGADEWINSGQNGFVVSTLEEMIETVTQLMHTPDLLKQNSLNAIAMAKRFDWAVRIKDWEQVIINLHFKDCVYN